MGFAENVSVWIAHRSTEAAIVIAVIFAIRWILGTQLPTAWRCALWLTVAIRLFGPGFIPLRGSVPQKIASITDRPPVIVHVDLSATPSNSAPPPNATPVPLSRISPIQIASLIYLAVAALLLLRIIAKHLILASRVRRMPLAEESLASLLSKCQRQIGISRRVRVAQTDQIRTPALCGIFCPTIMLPANIEFSHSELRMVLMHELAHAKKNHVLVGLATQIICALHWLNPMIWFASAAYRHDRELACDELVLKQLSHAESTDYGDCLIRMVKTLSVVPTHPATIGVFGSPNSLRRRIAMISNFQSRRANSRWVVGAITFLAIGCGALTTTGESKPPVQATAEQPKQPAVHPAINPADVTTREALERRLPEVNFDQVSFSDTIDFYRNITNTNIFVNWRALEAAGVSKNSPITTRLRDVKFSTALRKTLDDLGGGTVKLGYSVDDGVITISTADDLVRNVVTRVYDVRDLLAEIGDARLPNPKNPTTAPVADKQRQQRLSEIINLITEAIDPTSWRDAGGIIGSIRDYQTNQLVITQTTANHSQILELLEKLRESRAIQIDVQMRFIRFNPDQLPPKIAALLKPVAPSETPASPFFSGRQVDEIMRATQSAHDSSIVTAPRLTLFNGQSAFLEIATESFYVSSYKITKQPNGEMHYDPVVGQADSGLSVSLKGTASADHKYVTLMVQPKFSGIKSFEKEPFKGPDAPPGLEVVRAVLNQQNLSATANIPDGNTVILRAMPLPPSASEEPPTNSAAGNFVRRLASEEDNNQMLFIMITPKILIQQQSVKTK